MAQVKISALDEKPNLAATDMFVVAESTTGNKKVDKATLQTEIGDLVNDTSPVLGGDLDTDEKSIVTTANRDVVIKPNGTGVISVLGTTNYENNVTVDDDIPNRKYVEDKFVDNVGAETIAGVKTFSSFPITPSNAPSSNYQVANKKYVDDNAGGSDYIRAFIQNSKIMDWKLDFTPESTFINSPLFDGAKSGFSVRISTIDLIDVKGFKTSFDIFKIN